MGGPLRFVVPAHSIDCTNFGTPEYVKQRDFFFRMTLSHLTPNSPFTRDSCVSPTSCADVNRHGLILHSQTLIQHAGDP